MNQLIKKICAFITVLTVCLTLLATPVFAAEYTQLQKGDSGENVKQLQYALIGQGYLSGIADGDYGDMTKTAVTRFQSENNLSATGIADSNTLTLLFQKELERKENVVLKNGDVNDDVKVIKQRLIDLGYLFGYANNIFDDETETAVKAFQNRNKLSISGTVDKNTREALYSPNVVNASRASCVIPYYVEIITRYSRPYLKVTFSNRSNDIIDAIDFQIQVFNTYGDRLLVYDNELSDYNIEEPYSEYQFGRTFYPNTIMGLSRNEEIYLNSFRNHDGEVIPLVKVAVSKYHTQDGNTYSIPESEWIWYDNLGKSEVLPSKEAHGLPCGAITPELRERSNKIKIGVSNWLILWDYNADAYDMPYGGLFLTQYPNGGLLGDGDLKRSDVITNVDGFEIYTTDDLSYALAEGSKDGVVDITYFRNSIEKHVSVSTVKYVEKVASEDAVIEKDPAIKEESSDSHEEKVSEPITTEITVAEESEADIAAAEVSEEDKKAIYQDAMYLFIDGNYEEAKAAFEKLGNYERSLEFIEKCNAELSSSTGTIPASSLVVGQPVSIPTDKGTVSFQIDGAHVADWNHWTKARPGTIIVLLQCVLENIDYAKYESDKTIGVKDFAENELIVSDKDGFALEYFEVSGESDGLYEVNCVSKIPQNTKKRISLPYFAADGTQSIFISIDGYEKIEIPIAEQIKQESETIPNQSVEKEKTQIDDTEKGQNAQITSDIHFSEGDIIYSANGIDVSLLSLTVDNNSSLRMRFKIINNSNTDIKSTLMQYNPVYIDNTSVTCGHLASEDGEVEKGRVGFSENIIYFRDIEKIGIDPQNFNKIESVLRGVDSNYNALFEIPIEFYYSDFYKDSLPANSKETEAEVVDSGISEAEKEQIYQRAYWEFLSGKYEEAKADFEELGDYKDSANVLSLCEGVLNGTISITIS